MLLVKIIIEVFMLKSIASKYADNHGHNILSSYNIDIFDGHISTKA